MRGMYGNAKRNAALYAGSALLFIAFFAFIRAQTFVGNEAFIRSMVPHHSGAITMCEEATITDAELRELCTEIVDTQEREIREMQTILGQLRS